MNPDRRLIVLVVDDEPASLALVRGMVEALGFASIGAASGDEALELYIRERPNLVITDLMMPGLDGSQLLVRLRQENPEVPVLIMTVLDSVEHAVRLIKSGADDYLTKPLSLATLEPRLRAVVGRLEVQQDLRDLKQLIDSAFHPDDSFILGTSEAFLKIVARIPSLARTDATVNIFGESGTGKELVARAIHRASSRASAPMVCVSCANIPEGLWERELFGHARGAFTDAGSGGPGMIHAADGGTLFLDEVGEIPLGMQAKLLRFLQEKEYRPVGSTQVKRANVRLLTAGNRDLRAEVEQGRFRGDLYYRINVLPLELPPLRRRKEDIPHLAAHFLRRYAAEFHRPVLAFSPLALQKLCSYDYPGNVRELENIVQQVILSTRHSVVLAEEIPVGDAAVREHAPTAPQAPSGSRPLPSEAPGGPGGSARGPYVPVDLGIPYTEAREQFIRRFEVSYVSQLLRAHLGNVSRAAREAGLPRKSMTRIMNRHGLGAGPDGLGGRPGRPSRKT